MIINVLIKNLLEMKIIKLEEKGVYEYGIKLLLTSLFNAFWIMCIAIILQRPMLGIIYILILATVRTQIGGYHAKSYLGCFVCYNIFFAFSIFICKILHLIKCNEIMIALIGTIYLLLIYKFAPVPFAKILDDDEKKEARRKAFSRSFLWITIAVLVFGFKKYWSYEILSVLGISIFLMLTESGIFR